MTLDELRVLATGERNGNACWPEPYQMSPTLPECEFLHALVRMVAPRNVLELGTGMGVSSRFIAEALPKNGRLITVDYFPEYRDKAKALLDGQPVWGMTREPHESFDLVYIDSDPGHRSADIERWMTARPGATKTPPLVIVHDANRDYPQLRLGTGILMPSAEGFWIGRGL